jgi:hypothetical protein
MKSIITWTVSNGLFAVSLYFWLVEGVKGAENVASFFIWLSFVITVCVAAKIDDAVNQTKSKSSVPLWLDQLYDLIIIGILVWSGFFFFAGMYLFHMVILSYYKDRVEEKFSNQEK